jgi:hypothetical protein
MFRSRGPRRCTVHLPLRTDQLPTPFRTQLSMAHGGFATGNPGVSPDRIHGGRADNPRGRERTGSRNSWPAIFEPNRPGIRRGPPDPAFGDDLFSSFGDDRDEGYGADSVELGHRSAGAGWGYSSAAGRLRTRGQRGPSGASRRRRCRQARRPRLCERSRGSRLSTDPTGCPAPVLRPARPGWSRPNTPCERATLAGLRCRCGDAGRRSPSSAAAAAR